jgi:hypothetical protein
LPDLIRSICCGLLPAGFIAPCLPSKTDNCPSGSEWLHEIKHDGFRVIAPKNGRRVRGGRSPDWLKMKNADAPAVKREEEEDWGNKDHTIGTIGGRRLNCYTRSRTTTCY